MENYHFREFSPMTKKEWLDLATGSNNGEAASITNSLKLAPYFYLSAYFDSTESSFDFGRSSFENSSDWLWFEKNTDWSFIESNYWVQNGVQGITIEDQITPEKLNELRGSSLSVCFRGSNVGELRSFEEFVAVKDGFIFNHYEDKSFDQYQGLRSRMIDIGEVSDHQDVIYEIVLVLIHLDALLSSASLESRDKAWASCFVRLGVSTRYFQEILKLRCLRVLMPMIARRHGVSEQLSHEISIFSSLGLGMDDLDLDQQLLRLPVAMMAAIHGGAQAIEVDLKSDNKSIFHYRNISNILREEVGANRVGNPLLGSHFLHVGGGELMKEVWRHFQNVSANSQLDEVLKDYSRYLEIIGV